MQTLNAGGAPFTAGLFIDTYTKAAKVAPPRFLTLRLHPDLYLELYKMADIPMSIQLGHTLGPMGRKDMRVACIKPPMGVAQGILILKDPKADPTKLVFEVHGLPEFILENIYYDPPAPSA